MDAFTPQQTAELVSRIGTKKAHMRLDKLWWNSFMTGPLLGFGYASSPAIRCQCYRGMIPEFCNPVYGYEKLT